MHSPSAVAVGGAIGTLLRHGLAQAVPVAPDGVPWATLAANLCGALALGIVAGALGDRRGDPRWAWLTTGLLGALTTFSTFAVEVVDLLAVRPVVGGAYAVGAAVAGLALVALGRRGGRALVGTGAPA